jgi:hypothetical protein
MKPSARFRRKHPGILALLFTGLVAAAAPRGAPPAHPARLRWIIAASALARLRATPHPPGLVRRAFDHRRTWVIVGPHPPAFLGTWRCRRLLSFRRYAAMRQHLGRPSGIWGVLYDPEAWRFTPPAERRNVPDYARRAAQLAHSRGLKLVVTPATDLAHVLLPRPGNIYRAFVRLELARRIAPAADVYEIQSQGAETRPRLFVGYVAQEAAQVRAANPRAALLAGLSTNPHGLRVTAPQIFHEVLATRHLVQGYWLNVPSGGPSCPTCARARPKVAIQLLELLRDHGLLE